MTDPDQAWYWTPEWQAGEPEATEQITAGNLTAYNSADEMFAELID